MTTPLIFPATGPAEDRARRNRLVGWATTGASIGASATRGALADTSRIAGAFGATASNVLGATPAAAIAPPLALMKLGREGRQAYRAWERAQAAVKFINGSDAELSRIARYAYEKNIRRFKRLAAQAGLSATAIAAGIAVLATGVVTPAAGVAATVGLAAGIAKGTLSAGIFFKGVYKKLSGTLGKHRHIAANDLYDLAREEGHDDARLMLRELGVLKLTPDDRRGHFTLADLLASSNKEKIVAYIKQKIRSN